jgi:hypothetical protein
LFRGGLVFFHKLHLIVRAVLAFLDAWKWPDVESCASEIQMVNNLKYFSSISLFSTVWRGPSAAGKISRSAGLAPNVTCEQLNVFRSKPGRVFKGRWGSCESLEGKLRDTCDVIGDVFNRALKPSVAARPKKPVGPGADEEAKFREEWVTNRATVCELANSKLFLGTVVCSYVCKSSLTHFLAWSSSRVKEHLKRCRLAKVKGEEYMGPTPLSLLVCGQAEVFSDDINALLEESAMWDPTKFGPLLLLLPDELQSSARDLITSVVLLVRANWDFRVLRDVQDYPLLLLWFLEAPPGEAYEKRQHIARDLLAKTGDQLERTYSDITVKLRGFFLDEFREVCSTGKCPPRLFGALLVLRSKLPHNTQDIEGMNSILQIMHRVAPRLGLACANARMAMKIGDPISAEECVDLHKQVLQDITSQDNGSMRRNWPFSTYMQTQTKQTNQTF